MFESILGAVFGIFSRKRNGLKLGPVFDCLWESSLGWSWEALSPPQHAKNVRLSMLLYMYVFRYPNLSCTAFRTPLGAFQAVLDSKMEARIGPEI